MSDLLWTLVWLVATGAASGFIIHEALWVSRQSVDFDLILAAFARGAGDHAAAVEMADRSIARQRWPRVTWRWLLLGATS